MFIYFEQTVKKQYFASSLNNAWKIYEFQQISHLIQIFGSAIAKVYNAGIYQMFIANELRQEIINNIGSAI